MVRASESAAALTLALATMLSAGSAGAVATAWKPGGSARVRAERAALSWHPASDLEHLALDLDLTGATAGSVVIVPTPRRASVQGLASGVIADARDIEVDAGSAEIGPQPEPPEALATLAAKDLRAWLLGRGLEVGDGFAAWLKKQPEGVVLTVLPVAADGTLAVRLAFPSRAPFYPYARPAESIADDAGALELVTLGTTPWRWLPPNETPRRPASWPADAGSFAELPRAVEPTYDEELSGRFVRTGMAEATRAALGWTLQPALIWTARFRVTEIDRAGAGNVWFEVSPDRRSDRNLRLIPSLKPLRAKGGASARPVIGSDGPVVIDAPPHGGTSSDNSDTLTWLAILATALAAVALVVVGVVRGRREGDDSSR